MKTEKCHNIISSLPSHFCAKKLLDLLAKREVKQSSIVIPSKPTDASGFCPFVAAIANITASPTVVKVIIKIRTYSLAEIYNWIRPA